MIIICFIFCVIRFVRFKEFELIIVCCGNLKYLLFFLTVALRFLNFFFALLFFALYGCVLFVCGGEYVCC